MAETYKEPDKIQQYMASLEANLLRATGKSLAQWIKIAKTCPYGKTQERLNWFKKEHGLGQSRAGLVIWRAFGEPGGFGEEDPEKMINALFSKTFVEQRGLYDKVAAFARSLGEGTLSPRKGYVALYRLKQYGAIKPSKQGLLVGLALQKYPKSKLFIDVKNLGGGDRNKKALLLPSVKEFGAEAKDLIKTAWAEN
jgi:hypothetical protein